MKQVLCYTLYIPYTLYMNGTFLKTYIESALAVKILGDVYVMYIVMKTVVKNIYSHVQLDPSYSNSAISNSPLFQTQNYFP